MAPIPNPVCPELVEGLHFSSCGHAFRHQVKNSPSTGSGQTEFGKGLRGVVTKLTLLAFFALTACSKGEASGSAAGTSADVPEADTHIPCALAGAKSFTATCTREIAQVDGKEMWTIRAPDGGFRRFQILEGSRIATADGAWEVEAARVGSELEVRVADDRYRFPAAPEAASATATAR